MSPSPVSSYRTNYGAIPGRRWGSTSAYESAVLADSPLVYLRLDETSGLSCADTSGNGRTGTCTSVNRNIAAKSSALGVAVSVGGAGWISVLDTPALDITGDVTYEAWVKPTNYLTFETIMSKGQQSAGVAGYHFRVDQTTRALTVNKAATSALLTSSSVLPNDGAWHHVAFTRSGNLYTIYIDAVSSGTATIATTIDATNQVFMIGASPVGGVPAEAFNGALDEIAVYGTPLSGARLAAHVAAAAA